MLNDAFPFFSCGKSGIRYRRVKMNINGSAGRDLNMQKRGPPPVPLINEISGNGTAAAALRHVTRISVKSRYIQ